MSKIYLEDEDVFEYDLENLQTTCCKCLGNKEAKDISEFTICDACTRSAGQHFCRMMDCLEPFEERYLPRDTCFGFCTTCLITVISTLMEVDGRQCPMSKESLTSAVKERLTSAKLSVKKEEAFRGKYGLTHEKNDNILMDLLCFGSNPKYFRTQLVTWDTVHPQLLKVLNMTIDYQLYNKANPYYTFAIALEEDSINSTVAVKKTINLTQKDQELLASEDVDDAWHLVNDPADGWTSITWEELATMGIYIKTTTE
jgi:hypothetical protein